MSSLVLLIAAFTPLSYEDGVKQAVEKKQPLVVFVACPNVRPIQGVLVAKVHGLVGLPPDVGIVVMYPYEGQLQYEVKLKGCAPDATIQKYVQSAKTKIK